MSMIDNRYQIDCDCCGSVSHCARKQEAKRRMIEHMDRHELSETLTFSVCDLMAKGGWKQVYGGRIHEGVRSHGVWPFAKTPTLATS